MTGAQTGDAAVAIVGSGIAGSLLAHLLTSRGVRVDVFEKGPDYAYPHKRQYEEQVLYDYVDKSARLPPDLQNLVKTGPYRNDLDAERMMVVGGNGVRWGAMTDRLAPADFHTQSRYRYGADWPIDYAALEPHYCKAEALLGVSGSDEGDPFAAPRSQPYPLPPFAFSPDVAALAAQLRTAGISMRTTPQARTRSAFDGRPGCANIGACETCPIGARYSPNHHLARALATGKCTLYTNQSVRRILLDAKGRARALLVRGNHEPSDREHPARVLIVAAGTIESVRLLFLSAAGAQSNGLGNASGQLGKHFLMHHIYMAHFDYEAALFPGRTGADLCQTRQFVDPETRGEHGGVLFQMPSQASLWNHLLDAPPRWQSGEEVLRSMRPLVHCEGAFLHCEPGPSDEKYIALADKRDRFGDAFARVQYQPNEFDLATHAFAKSIGERVAAATSATAWRMQPPDSFNSGHHHVGGTRMAARPRDGVVDSLGAVFGVPNLYVAGSSNFPGATALHPTLTIAALASRTADAIFERL